MSSEQNKNRVKQIFEEAMNNKNADVVSEAFHPEYVNHGIPNLAPGVEGFKQIMKQFTGAFPDIHITVEEVIGEGESVATRGTWTGTHKGDFMGIPATGKQVKVPYIDFWKFENGKAKENWVQMDMMGMMQQLGVGP